MGTGCIGHVKDSLFAAADTTLGDVGVSAEIHIATDEPHATCSSAGDRELKSRDEESNKDLGKVLEVVGVGSECYGPSLTTLACRISSGPGTDRCRIAWHSGPS